MLESRIDWVHGIFPFTELGSVGRLLKEYFGDEPTEGRAFWTYKDRADVGEGVTVLCSKGDADTDPRPEGCLILRGAACSRLTTQRLLHLLADLRGIPGHSDFGGVGFEARRLDVCIDDFDKRIVPADLYARFVRPGHWSGAKLSRCVLGGQGDGSGVYLGQRGQGGSGVSLCVYDKDVESGGKIKSIRWEARYDGKRVEAALDYLLSTSLPIEKRLADLAFGQFEFYEPDDKAGAKNAHRRKVAAFWKGLKVEAGTSGVTFCGPASGT